MAEIRAHIQRAGNDAQGVQDYLDGIDADLNDLRNQTGTQLVTEQVEKPGQAITGKVVDLLKSLNVETLNQTKLGGQDVGITGASDQTNISESRDQAEKAERRRQRKLNQQNFRDDAAREFGEPVQNPRSTKPGYYQVTRAGAREVGPSHFTLDAAGKSSGTADSALGVWAASKESSAAAYGDVLRDYIFHYKKPLAINADVWEEVKPDTVEEAIEFRNGLLEDGYDGLIITGHSQYNHHVALKPESVVKASEKRMSESFVDMSAIPLMQVEEVGGEPLIFNQEKVNNANDILKIWRDLGVNGSISESENSLTLNKIVVDEADRGKGVGSKAMRLLIDYADKKGKLIALTPSKDFGAKSIERLNRFYKNLGFVENKGKNKDFEISESMYRVANKNVFNQNADGTQGQIAILPEGAVIKLFESANLSTFLHESAHLFLHMTGKLYSHPKATPEIKVDGNAILSFLGAESFESLTVDQHEKWARGMERYFGEGKAPSLELQGPFRRFTQWIKQIYRSLTNLNVELTDDIRKVMDRMLASDEQIDRLAGNFRPLFKDAKDAGMTPAEFKAYDGNAAPEAAKEELFKKLVKDLRRQEEKWWKDEKGIIQEQIAEELKKLPVYSAEQYLRDNSVKISLPQIKAVIPGKLPKRLYGLNAEDGKNADELAAMFGFASGEEMINQLANSKTLKQYSSELSESEMVARHGDTLNDGSIEEQAQLAMRNDSRAKKLLAELRSLAKKTGKQAIDRESMREYARTTIAKMKIRSINPSKYRAAEIRSARAAAAAKAKGDIDAAHKAKTQEIINFYLGKEASLAKDKAEKIRSSHKAIQSREYDSKKYNNEPYINKAKLLIRVFDYRKLSKKDEVAAKAELEMARLWIESQQVGDPEKASPYLVQAEILNRLIPYKEMTVEDLQGLDDTVQSLIKAARETSEAANKIFQDEMDSLGESIIKNRIDNYQTEFDGETPYSKMRQLFDGLASSVRKLDSYARQSDAFNEQGPVWKKIVKPLLDASRTALNMRNKAGSDLKEIFAGYEGMLGSTLGSDIARDILSKTGVPVGDGNKRTFRFESGQVHRLSYGARISVALNMGNAGNYEALTNMSALPLTANDLNQIIATLSDRDLDLVQKIWDYIDTYWPIAAELEKKRSGAAPIKVQPMSFITPSGRVMKGGYFPLVGDPANDTKLGDIDTQAAKFIAGGSVSKATKTGSLIERTKFGGKKINFSLNVVFNHIDEVIHDVSHWQAVHDVNRVLSNKRVNAELTKSLGTAGVRAIQQRLKEVAAGPQRIEALTWWERPLRYARLATTYGALGYSVSTAIKNMVGVTTAVPELGALNITEAIIDYSANSKKIKEFILSRSEYMNERSQVINRDIAQIRASIRTNSKIDKFKDYAFWFMTQTDTMVTRPIWMAAYKQAQQKFDTESEAIDYADQMVMRTQGSGETMNLSNVETRSELMRTMTVMYSAMNSIYNIAAEQVLRHKARKIGSAGAITTAQLFNNLMWVTVWPGIAMAMFSLSDGDDEPEDIVKKITAEVAGQALGLVPWARDVYSLTRYNSSFPSPLTELGHAPIEFVEQVSKGEIDKGLVRATTGLMSASHIPGGAQMNRSLGYMIDMMDNEVDSFSPWELIVTGKE